MRYADGAIVTFDAPGAAPELGIGTYVYAINDAGAIAGAWQDANGIIHGFVMEKNGD